MQREVILGFDARQVGPLVRSAWTDARRADYLLGEAALPLSVDELVWPSAFAEPSDHYATAEAVAAKVGGYVARPLSGWIPRPTWIGANDLWDNLPQMRAQIGKAQLAPSQLGAIWEIAITWHSAQPLERGLTGPYDEPTVPSERDPSWQLLGFDVADPGISGLTNCGYTVDERDACVARWASLLNEHHLFRTLADADAFRVFSNDRVSEHAPFFVLGLWRLLWTECELGNPWQE